MRPRSLCAAFVADGIDRSVARMPSARTDRGNIAYQLQERGTRHARGYNGLTFRDQRTSLPCDSRWDQRRRGEVRGGVDLEDSRA